MAISTRDSKISSILYGQEILKLEAEAILRLSELLDENFDKAIETIMSLSPEGRVIVSGIGKAGFIAMKISATLASTGIPSFFLHPAEAVHGDLGRYTKKDMALILSNSGGTSEIVKIIPHIKLIGCPIISITCNGDSALSRHSDVVIKTGSLQEAGPLGLAPTTSTTVMLALGDALAMALLNKRSLTKEQFRMNHPGGSLGRSLMLVSEIMRTDNEHCVVSEKLPTREVLHRITCTEGRPGAAALVDDEGKLSGIFTDGNLRRHLEGKTDFLDKPISEIMTRSPKVVAPDKLAEEAFRIMKEHRIDQVLVVDDDNRPIGIVDIQEFISNRL